MNHKLQRVILGNYRKEVFMYIGRDTGLSNIVTLETFVKESYMETIRYALGNKLCGNDKNSKKLLETANDLKKCFDWYDWREATEEARVVWRDKKDPLLSELPEWN